MKGTFGKMFTNKTTIIIFELNGNTYKITDLYYINGTQTDSRK